MAQPRWHISITACLFLHCMLLLAQCPPLGSILPAPTGLSQDPTFQQVASAVNKQLQTLTSSFNQTALSVGMRSLHDNAPLLNFHYTPQEYNTSGTHKVDGNTVYRVGSVTKLFTALSILQLEGKVNPTDPVTKYVPKLNNVSGSENSLASVDWNLVTIEALLCHLGGVPAGLSDNDLQASPGVNALLGLPDLAPSQQALPCGNGPDQASCSWDVFLANIARKPPVYRPFTSPVYSNVGYSVLGRVVENVSGKTYADYLQQNVLKIAGMNRTTVDIAPANNLGFIPAESNWWGTSMGFRGPEGGIYSSNNDLLSFGAAILSNKLLSPAQTRAWLKPVTFTSSMGLAVGAPWEIARGPNLTSDGRIIDFYAKEGDVGDYTGMLILVPDYDLVMALNVAGPDLEGASVLGLFSQLIQGIIPVVDQIGKAQASVQLTGTYAAGRNSSLDLSVDDFGVVVSNFSMNGVDVASGYGALRDAGDEKTTIRLYPTNLQDGNATSWRAVYTIGTPSDVDSQLFFPQGSCQTWLLLDRIEYGVKSIDDFVLTADKSGKIVTVEPVAWRAVLSRAD